MTDTLLSSSNSKKRNFDEMMIGNHIEHKKDIITEPPSLKKCKIISEKNENHHQLLSNEEKTNNDSSGINTKYEKENYSLNTNIMNYPKKQIYYQSIVHRSSRTGVSFQATNLPKCNQSSADSHLGGTLMIIEPDDHILRRKERDLQRQRIDDEMYDEQQLQQILQISEREAIGMEMDAISNTNEMSNDNYKYSKSDKAELSDDDDDEVRDEKKEMNDELLTDDDDEDYDIEEDENNMMESDDDVRVMRGILGRRVDWLPGEVISDKHRTQYLVLWENCTEPVWEFCEDLQGFYSREMDEFEDNDMEDEWEEDQKLLNIRSFTVRYENNCNSNTNYNV